MNELDASRKQKQIGKSAEMPRLLTGCKVMREHVTAVNPEGRKGSPRDERKVALLSLSDGSTTRRVDITWTSGLRDDVQGSKRRDVTFHVEGLVLAFSYTSHIDQRWDPT